MKYILMMNGTKASFAEYAKWSKKDMEANVAFMRAFSKELKDEGVLVATEGLGWPDQAKIVRAGKNGAPSRTASSRNPRSSSPDTGSWTWRARSRRTRSPRALPRRPGPVGSRATCPSRCGRC